MKRIKEEICNMIDAIGKDIIIRDFIILITSLLLYFIGVIFNLIECIIIYLLVRIWISNELGGRNGTSNR